MSLGHESNEHIMVGNSLNEKIETFNQLSAYDLISSHAVALMHKSK